MVRTIIPLANGVEEMEAVIITDTLRRAGWEVTTAGLTPGVITASRGVKLVPDKNWMDVNTDIYDVLVLPGGSEGVSTISKNKALLECIRHFASSHRWIAAICAGPLALQAAGILKNRRVTSYPSVRSDLSVVEWSGERTVCDGRILTSQGPGSSFEFALRLIELVESKEVAKKVASGMLVEWPSADRKE